MVKLRRYATLGRSRRYGMRWRDSVLARPERIGMGCRIGGGSE
jgi:hypothetical protein